MALGLAMVAGTGFAQPGSSTRAGAQATGTSVSSALEVRFHQLDTNDDGRLSRVEAQADPRIADLYDSLDTSSTMERNSSNAAVAGGISLDQFTAGMEAAMEGGVVGPAVSGGGTYIQMRDGSLRKADGMQDTTPGNMAGRSSNTPDMSDSPQNPSQTSPADSMPGASSARPGSTSSDDARAYSNGMNNADQSSDSADRAARERMKMQH